MDDCRKHYRKDILSDEPKMIVIDTCNAGKLGEALQMAILTRGMSEETAIKILYPTATPTGQSFPVGKVR
jgi:hypothetical protein